MPAQIAIDLIVKKILQGIIQAQKDYSEWTDGDWLWTAPEYLLTTCIAQKIMKLDGSKYLTLENNAKSAIEEAGAKGKGKLNARIRSNGRFDILLWWGSYNPRAVIEVKNQITSSIALKNDLLRIREVLRRKQNVSTFQFGAMAYYTSTFDSKRFSAKERILKRTHRILRDAQGIVGENLQVVEYRSRIRVEDDSAWVAVVLLIKKSGLQK